MSVSSGAGISPLSVGVGGASSFGDGVTGEVCSALGAGDFLTAVERKLGGMVKTPTDLPGSYSLMANSPEEEIARDFICFGKPAVAVLVADATCLERNLNLVLQVLEMTRQAVVCVNLMDEAERNHISIRLDKLSQILGVPVVGTSASSGRGLTELKDAVGDVLYGRFTPEPIRIEYDSAIEEAVSVIETCIKEITDTGIDSRWMALRILEGDDTLITALRRYTGYDVLSSEELNERLEKARKILEKKQIHKEDRSLMCRIF